MKLERDETDSVGGVDTVENGDLIPDGHVGEFRADLLQFVSDATDLSVRAVGFEVMAEHAFPVGLLARVDGMPVPVFNHIRAAGNVSIDIEAQLPVVWRVLAGGNPPQRLRLCFCDEV